MKIKSYENVKDQIGFCGIWCGSCPAGNGVITELTRLYEEIIKKNKIEKWAPKDFNFNEFMKGLSSIQKIKLCPGCHEGGGNPACEIRICAKKRKIINCSQCDELLSCKNFSNLEKNHPRIKEDLKEIKNVDQKQLLKKWIGELKEMFPSCILLCNKIQL